MITGIGTDLIDIRRVESAFRKFGQKFERRVYSENEIKKARSIKNKKKRMAFYAKRFAVKEAVSKATGTGIGSFAHFKDISIENDARGKPFVKLKGKTKPNIYVSISDEYPYAQAFVVIAGKE